ncbi:MAG: KinB-signaling pathway activation protein [Bacilli bacterium]
MTIRVWVPFFFKTLMLGGVLTLFASIVLQWESYEKAVLSNEYVELLFLIISVVGMGMLYSLVAQMGFFAYLTVHRFGLGFFGGEKLWNAVQYVLIVFAIFDLLYFKVWLENWSSSSVLYIACVLVLIAVAYFAAVRKVKETNPHAFVPALFFIVVVTMIEWIPGIRVDSSDWVVMMFVTLLICNVFQLLMLHKLIQRSQR